MSFLAEVNCSPGYKENPAMRWLNCCWWRKDSRRTEMSWNTVQSAKTVFLFFLFFFFHLFLLVGGQLLYNIVVVFAIHWHESAMDLHVFPILNPLPTSLPIPTRWVIPVHQPWSHVSCIQPGLAICFTLVNIHVLMLFSHIIPPSPSPIESRSLFCTSVSLFLCKDCLDYSHEWKFRLNFVSVISMMPSWKSSNRSLNRLWDHIKESDGRRNSMNSSRTCLFVHFLRVSICQ